MMTVTPGYVPAIPPGGAIRVLIAEDEAHLGTILEQFLTARGFNVRVVRNGREALDLLVHETFDVALLDVVMPEIDGLEVLRMVREQPMPPEVIVITGNGTIETAMAALRLGAYDFLSKPYRMAEIDALVRRAWEKRVLVRDNRHLRARMHRDHAQPVFLTQFAPLVAVMNMTGKFAGSPLPVLITGDIGTGKHTVARLLHAHGERRGAFVRLDCRAVAATTHMAELFGVSSPTPIGSEDDAAPVVGALELAAAGTLFLDRVDCLARDAQQALLAALDAGEFIPRGDARRRTLDVRVVASSTRDLGALATAGAFSEALLHRLGAMRVTLPPLRERATDIPLLAEHFLQQAAAT